MRLIKLSKALSALPVGSKVEIPINAAFQSRFGAKMVFKVADKNHSGYPSGAVTLITEKIIQIMANDGREASNSDTNRQNYGNNRHIWSNVLQWLNSSAAAGAWYTAKHAADAPPSSGNINGGNFYDTWAGFLAMLPADFVNAILTTTLTVARNTVTDGGGSETFTTKMFLASTTEVGLANENSVAEGSLLALFTTDNASRLAYPTAEAVNNANGYTNANFATAKAWHWWLRTPYSANSSNVRIVNTSGALSYDNAFRGLCGLRPLCNLPSEILVSDAVNADGNYEMTFNQSPTAPQGISLPSTCYSGQTITAAWGAATDPEGDAITYAVERSVNNAAWSNVTTTAGLTYTDNVLTSWNTVQYRVKAVDAYGNSSAYIASGQSAVIHNRPPEISGYNADLGVQTGGVTYDYTVTDADGDVVTVAEAVDGAQLRAYVVTLNQQNTATVAGANWVKLHNGQHALTITATDSANNITARALMFEKQADGFTITTNPPLESDTRPSRVNIVVHRVIAAGAVFMVEVCNNPFDDLPVWEDATAAVLQSRAHVFTNTSQTAAQFGLGLRVTVSRNGAIGECYTNGIGGNFE